MQFVISLTKYKNLLNSRVLFLHFKKKNSLNVTFKEFYTLIQFFKPLEMALIKLNNLLRILSFLVYFRHLNFSIVVDNEGVNDVKHLVLVSPFQVIILSASSFQSRFTEQFFYQLNSILMVGKKFIHQ